MRKTAFMATAVMVILTSCGGYKVGDTNVTPPPQEIQEINDDGFDMVLVEGGTFTVGCDCHYSQRPRREVTLKDFYIGRYEVTQRQWKAVMDSNPSRFDGDDNLPVERVSWNDVQNFIRKLNAKTGGKYRLPSEAEWEYAARGGNKSEGYEYSGSDDFDEVGWHGGISRDGGHGTHPVGTKLANELGIHDMTGNVSEWTNDIYLDRTKDGYRERPDRAVRGGNWQLPPGYCTVYELGFGSPGQRYDGWGFRLALSAGEDAPLPAEDTVTQTAVSPEEDGGAVRDGPLADGGIDAILSGIPLAAASPPDVTSNPDSIAMVFVGGGTFMMGCVPERDGENWGGPDFYCPDGEKPARETAVGSFYISKYEATQGLWKAVTGGNPSDLKGSDNLPVENVSWNDVQKFIRILNAKTGKKYRLPSEAEWEYAARGGNKSRGYWYSGSNDIYKVAWHCDNSGYDTGDANVPKPVGVKAPNELGIHDMSGNVWEWTGTANGSDYALRGGGSGSFSTHCHLFNRYDRSASGYSASPCCYNSSPFGFRLALDP